jgi:hypothetical protein
LEKLHACREEIVTQYPSAEVLVQAFDRSSEDEVDQFFATVTQSITRIHSAVNVVSQAQGPQVPTGLSIEEYDRSFSIYQKGVRIAGFYCSDDLLLRNSDYYYT